MIKELLILPLIGLIVISFASQLAVVAESASEKTFMFTQEMDNAMDCAFRGVPIRECSPTLMDYNFTPETEDFKELNKEYINQLKGLLDELNNTNLTNSSNVTITITIS